MGTFLESVFEKHIMPVQDTTSVLWTKNEIASWIGYSERTIEKIINNYSDFPGKRKKDAWLASDVIDFFQKNAQKRAVFLLQNRKSTNH